MASLNHDGSIKDVSKMEPKSEETKQQASSRNTYKFLANRYKLKASSRKKGIKYNCKECGK